MITTSDILDGKILIVDDQQVNVVLLERILGSAGYVSIHSTTDPAQVCALHLKNRYDLILLDLQMPGMDGFQVMEALKQVDPDGYLPVLVITAQPGHKLHALEAGAKDFISKPFELAEVLARVHNMLEVRLLHKKSRSDNNALEKQVCEQASLLIISHILASTLELQPDLILDQLHELIAYTRGRLFALTDSSLVTLAMRGTRQFEKFAPVQVSLNTSVTLFNSHQPIRIANMRHDNLQTQFLHSILGGDASEWLEGMQSWMWVPMAIKGRLIGGIGMVHQQANYFTNHHADLALNVANQAAITMLNAELNEQAQALAVLEERQRLARDLHDAVNQSLFAAGLIVETLPRLWDLDQLAARRSLEELRMLVRGVSAEMRGILTELRPSTLTDSKLSDLLRLQGDAFSGRTNIPVAFTVTGEFNLPDEVQVAFYRVCQEALNNIAKHAMCSHVVMDLRRNGAFIELRILDDGQGFDPEQTISGHYGLGMMRERAEAAGAVLSIISQPGHGTELTIIWNEVPLMIVDDHAMARHR